MSPLLLFLCVFPHYYISILLPVFCYDVGSLPLNNCIFSPREMIYLDFEANNYEEDKT